VTLTSPRTSGSHDPLVAYYAATAVFLLLDYGLDINVRLAFLDTRPGMRAGYYGVLAACFGLILWRPGWAAVIGAFESLVTLIALILSMALRAMFLADPLPESQLGPVTVPEIVNFLLAGSIANLAWLRGLRALRDDPPHR